MCLTKGFSPELQGLCAYLVPAPAPLAHLVAPRHLVRSNSTVGTLPSGTQTSDLMIELHKYLWRQTSASTGVMTKPEYERRRANGEDVEIVNPEKTFAGDDSPGAKATGQPVPESTREGGLVVEDERSPGEDEREPAGAPQPVNNDAAEAGQQVMVWLPMPEDWLHPFSLAFCSYSKIAEKPDHDLDLAASDGPTHANPQGPGEPSVAGTEDSCDVESSLGASGRLSKHSIATMGAANASVSRREMKKRREEPVNAARNDR